MKYYPVCILTKNAVMKFSKFNLLIALLLYSGIAGAQAKKPVPPPPPPPPPEIVAVPAPPQSAIKGSTEKIALPQPPIKPARLKKVKLHKPLPPLPPPPPLEEK